MSTASQNATGMSKIAADSLAHQGSQGSGIELVCPGCNQEKCVTTVERYGRHELFACAACGLQFWNPRVMPDARWYEAMYGGRDEKAMPLEPGHVHFLNDPQAPGKGNLLDVGCGTGNFLVAAREAGYQVTGTELDSNAARFAKEQLGLPRVLPLSITEFAEKHPGEKFDCVTFFEVLEHQAAPAEFLEGVKACLRPHGTIALSVPNRERWLTGPDVNDYPPNHFLRWSPGALKNFLNARGFEVLSMKEQRADVSYTAQMINMAIRTGITQAGAQSESASFRDVMQMPVEEAAEKLKSRATPRHRIMQMLGRMKHAACFPLAVAAIPYVRMRGYKGIYLYCLARQQG
jgi:SAM-dependent methyltransferase